jgi:hypothetical protein
MDAKTENTNKYWDDEIMKDLIAKYQAATSISERNEVFAKMYPSLYRLAEYNAMTCRLREEPKTHIDCILSQFAIALEKYDPSKATNAFSYFNVSARNYSVYEKIKNKKTDHRHVVEIERNGEIEDSLDNLPEVVEEKVKPYFYVKNDAKCSLQMRERAKQLCKFLNNNEEIYDILVKPDTKQRMARVREYIIEKNCTNRMDFWSCLKLISYKFQKK